MFIPIKNQNDIKALRSDLNQLNFNLDDSSSVDNMLTKIKSQLQHCHLNATNRSGLLYDFNRFTHHGKYISGSSADEKERNYRRMMISLMNCYFDRFLIINLDNLNEFMSDK